MNKSVYRFWKPLRPDPLPKESIEARYENAIAAYEQALTLKRYSWRTIKLYKHLLRGLFLGYNDTKPSQITRKIDKYVAQLRVRPAGNTASAVCHVFLKMPDAHLT